MSRAWRTALRGLAAASVTLVLLAGPGRLLAQPADVSDQAATDGLPVSDAPAPRPRLRPQAPRITLPVPPAAQAAPQTAPVEAPVAEDPAQSAPPEPAPAPAPPPPPAVGRLQPGTPIPAAELEAFLEGVVRQAMADEHIPGLTLAVVQNGQTVLKKGYGAADLSPTRPVDPDRTLFRVGSVSKLFTWMLVMREVERGHMRLDAPANLYLPEQLQVRDQGYARPVLLRDLMTHSAGFEDRMLGRLFERNPDRIRPLALYLRQEKPRRVRPPGVIAEYSNYGAALAGEAVSQVTGHGYEDLVEAEITRPLGLNHTTFREPYPAVAGLPAPMPAAMAQDVSGGFRWTGAVFEPRPFEYASQLAPAGSASSTAADMARFMTLILANGTLDGKSVYSAQTAQAFRTPTLRAAPGLGGFDSGFMQRRLPGGFEGFGHLGTTLSFRTNLVTVPALDLGVFVSANSETGEKLVQSLPGLVIERFYAPPAPPPPGGSPQLYEQRAAYAGDYLTEKRRYGGLEQFIALLTGVVHVDVTREGRLVARDRDGAAVWAPTDTPGQFKSLDGVDTAAFQMVDGVAQRWFPPSGLVTYQRIGVLWQGATMAALFAAAMIASAAVLIGIATRDRLQFRQTPTQGAASALQTSTAVLWFFAAGGLAAWALPARTDTAYGFYDWPGPWVIAASACALVAFVFSILQVAMLPGVWRGGRRVDSWTAGRKLRFSVTAFIYLGFGALLLMWGALEPWSA
jgi:CubicO group peptidase (beta-lactamase class C family)